MLKKAFWDEILILVNINWGEHMAWTESDGVKFLLKSKFWKRWTSVFLFLYQIPLDYSNLDVKGVLYFYFNILNIFYYHIK